MRAFPADLRRRLEEARLDSLTLFRSLDKMDLTPSEIPQSLIQQLFELDADCVEALWALDQPEGSFSLKRMLRDTLASLKKLPFERERFRKKLPKRAHPTLESLETAIRKDLDAREAYNQVPGRNPQNC